MSDPTQTLNQLREILERIVSVKSAGAARYVTEHASMRVDGQRALGLLDRIIASHSEIRGNDVAKEIAALECDVAYSGHWQLGFQDAQNKAVEIARKATVREVVNRTPLSELDLERRFSHVISEQIELVEAIKAEYLEDDMLIPNLVMFIGRLCYRLKVCPEKTKGNVKIIAKTMDYLKRKGLEKNALRYEESRNKPEIEGEEGGK